MLHAWVKLGIHATVWRETTSKRSLRIYNRTREKINIEIS
jgi:hypothetical protein